MGKLKENTSVVKRPGDNSKIFCHEDYAQEMYDALANEEVVYKDLRNGEVLRVLDFRMMSNNEVEIVCENFETLYFSLKKERRFFELIGMNEESFVEWVENGNVKEELKERKIYASVENTSVRKGSLYSAHLMTIAREFREQITKPTSAYIAKVLMKNQGGFIVDVQGIKAFLPGSLAAANKIVDFENYIGKEIFVMIEDYLQSSDIFVVSYKKYLDYILPSKLGELERNQVLVGTVTGTSKFGVFIEFDDIFTGLLHKSEMSPETAEKFNSGNYRSGDQITVWLKDIRDNKLILTETDPSIRENEMIEFREKVEGSYHEASIISIKPHGALMEIEKGVLGLLPVKEMKKSGRRLEVGESLNVFIKKVDTSTGKIYLTLTDERVTEKV